METDTWPQDIRWIREAFLKDWRKWTAHDQSTVGWTPSHPDFALTASPRFFVARDGELLGTAAALAGWDHYVAPLLAKIVGT